MDVSRGAGKAVFFEVLLMVFFCAVKVTRRYNPGDDGSGKLPGGLESDFRIKSGLSLLWAVVENHRAILTADIGALAVELGGVVDFPEDFQKPRI